MSGWGIAIVAMAARLPGGPLSTFFDRLLSGADASRDVPEGRWLAPSHEVISSKPYALDHTLHARGYFLDHYDQTSETNGLDPVFGVTLSTAREALLQLRGPQMSLERIGLILGNLALPSTHSSLSTHASVGACLAEQLLNQSWDEAATPPADMDPAGNPVRLAARVLGLGGPTLAIDAACASSLYALALASRALLDGRADAMLAGGVARPDPLYTQMGFTQLRALAPDGRCRPFDANGRGLVVGEGAGVFVLKRLADAVAHGDNILGVIQGIGLANDLDASLMAPSSEGQLRAMRAAYEAAGWRPSDVDVIECHATGTPVGDRVEVESLTTLWQDEGAVLGQCPIGSVKANVGHMLTAAGASGLIKLLLSLRHGQIPPTANYQQSAPTSPLRSSPFCVLREARIWSRRSPHLPRRAALSGFGFGGINAHLLLEEYLSTEPTTKPTHQPLWAQSRRRQVALVGIDVACRGVRGFDAWRQMRREDRLPEVAAPRWWGAETTGFLQRALGGDQIANTLASLSPLEDPQGPWERFHFPPVEWREMLPQQAWMLLVAEAATQGGALLTGIEPHRRGVAIGLALDGLANVFSLRWRLAQKADAWNTSLENLRQELGHELTYGRVLGALGNLVASRITRELHCGGFGIAIANGPHSGLDALYTVVRAIENHDLDGGIAGACDLPTTLPTYLAARAQRQQDGRNEPARTVDAAVACVLLDAQSARVHGHRVYAWIETDAEGGVVLASDTNRRRLVEGAELEAGAATAILSVLDGVAMLTDKYDSSKSYWLRNRSEGQRHVSFANSLRLIEPSLREAVETRPQNRLNGHECFFLAASSRQELRLQLEDPLRYALHAPQWSRSDSPRPFRVGLAFDPKEPEAFAQRITAVQHWLDRCISPADSPLDQLYCGEGIACSASWRRARTALMYPGSGSWYSGMGRELAAAFPSFAEDQDSRVSRYADIWGRGTLWQEVLSTPSPATMISAQCALGILTTQILLTAGVQADAAFGYSLGESAALLALGIWPDQERLFERLVASPIFTTELVGPMHALSRHWQLPGAETPNWTAGLVHRSAHDISAALKGLEHTYLLNINTPSECVIAGDPKGVALLYQRLDHQPLMLSGIPALHCSVVREIEAEFRAFHNLPVTIPRQLEPQFRFYSCARGKPVALEREALADSVLAHGLYGVNWPQLMEHVADDGIECFIEPGPGASLGRLVAACLAGRPFKTLAVCPRDGEEINHMISSLLTSHALGHAIDPQALMGHDRTQDKQRPHAIKSCVDAKASLADRSPAVVAFACAPFKALHIREQPSVGPSAGKKHHKYPQVTPAERIDQTPDLDLIAPTEKGFMRWQANTIIQFTAIQAAEVRAQAKFLEMQSEYAKQLHTLVTTGAGAHAAAHVDTHADTSRAIATSRPWLDFEACQEFARGSIGRVLGPEFAPIDHHPTRVRLPDGPLLLCHRMMSIEATPLSMSQGILVTEHDVTADAWYLDGGRIPTCVAVEAGQADLFLAAYLGADFHTKGLAVYRLLDATVIFHGRLPQPGQTIRYVIHLDHFFRQGKTLLFRFGFDATVDGEPLITMRDGCAGFFTSAELAAGKGIVRTAMQAQPAAGRVTGGFSRLVSMRPESLDEAQLDALRRGDYVAAFGWSFDGLPLQQPKQLPDGMLRLVHRIPTLEPDGGRWGLGRIVGEADIYPDDWFLTCHFVDDMVMPGTLMYECCLHTLRVFLMRMGWLGEEDTIACEPVPGIKSRLKCRGQVLSSTQKVRYEIEIKELGYGPDAYALADATMFANERAIVEIADMSIRHLGLTRGKVEQLWKNRRRQRFGSDSILALAEGRVSAVFGSAFARFDDPKVRIARLPRSPYGFLDRVDASAAEPLIMRAGGSIRGEYSVPTDAWYFAANDGQMPFAILNEIALQACGFYSAYMGAALVSDADLYYRNLGGKAQIFRGVTPDSGRLFTEVQCTQVARTGDMILHEFAFTVSDALETVYAGSTNFGFFTGQALANQIGLRATPPRNNNPLSLPYPDRPRLPIPPLRMIDTITELDIQTGIIRGAKRIDPKEWFFAAHFHQDPVMPGSLGLEAMAQLLQLFASEIWPGSRSESLASGYEHVWTYRGQVLPSADLVEVIVQIKSQDAAQGILVGDGLLIVDGLAIYQMQGLAVRRL